MLDADTRTRVRMKIDELTRLRVAVENENLDLCKSCGMPRSDWTPGCQTCWDRHRSYEKGRTKCPYLVDSAALHAQVRWFGESMMVIRERTSDGRLAAA